MSRYGQLLPTGRGAPARSGLDAAAGEPRQFLDFIPGAVDTRRANNTTRSANDWQIAYQATNASVAILRTLGQGIWTCAC